MPKIKSFDDTFTETIGEVLKNIFEDDTSNIIMDYLEKNSAGKHINEKAQIFSKIIPKILGVGSVIIEDLIIETLSSKYGLSLQKKNGYTFIDYVTDIYKRVDEIKS